MAGVGDLYGVRTGVDDVPRSGSAPTDVTDPSRGEGRGVPSSTTGPTTTLSRVTVVFSVQVTVVFSVRVTVVFSVRDGSTGERVPRGRTRYTGRRTVWGGE